MNFVTRLAAVARPAAGRLFDRWRASLQGLSASRWFSPRERLAVTIVLLLGMTLGGYAGMRHAESSECGSSPVPVTAWRGLMPRPPLAIPWSSSLLPVPSLVTTPSLLAVPSPAMSSPPLASSPPGGTIGPGSGPLAAEPGSGPSENAEPGEIKLLPQGRTGSAGGSDKRAGGEGYQGDGGGRSGAGREGDGENGPYQEGEHGQEGDTRPARRAKLAIVIDDWGYDWPAAREFLALRVPLTVAVIPHAPLTHEHAERARKAGFEVLVHLPMEPFRLSGSNGSASADMVRVDMETAEIQSLVARAIADVPRAVGMSNHQGSRATSDPQVMGAVLEVVREHGLFFLDSRTAPSSVAATTGQELGVPTARNDLFIDNDDRVEAIVARLREGARLARREGSAIVIGHVHRATAAALRQVLPELARDGIELVPVSQLVSPPGTSGPALSNQPR
ncbi:MAG TPA: divergent polysaccharide deacetylase family protein [Firmicutes bacterium]|nr:divergent polysaccharide deacetylase family protein [Bacillota bacterium]